MFILVFMPYVKVHESMYCIIVISLEGIAFFILPFMKLLLEYYGVTAFALMQYGAWATAR